MFDLYRFGLLPILSFTVLFVSQSAAQNSPILTNIDFFGESGDGLLPTGLAIGSHRRSLPLSLWVGQTPAPSTVLKLTLPAKGSGSWVPSTIYTFPGYPGDGLNPSALTIGPDGALYGTTVTGGASGQGTVFRLTAPAAAGVPSTETLLYNFTAQPDASQPYTRVVFGSHGELYGTTSGGGTAGFGTVFKLDPPAQPNGYLDRIGCSRLHRSKRRRIATLGSSCRRSA